MPVTLEIAGRAVTRLGNAAVSVPVIVRNAQTLAVAWSGTTDPNGFFTSAVLDDAAEYRAEVEYDTTNHFKTLRDLASGQMNMLQVRKRFHVRGATTPCVIEGPMAAAAITAAAITATSVNAPTMQRGGQNLWGPDNDGPGTGLDADTVDGQQAAAFAASGHDHATAYAPISHSHAIPANPVLKGANGSYSGNGINSARTVFTCPGGGVPIQATIWEGSGGGAGACWVISNIFNIVTQMNLTADEVISATGFVVITGSDLIVNNNTGAGAANGLNANLNGINYEYAVIYV